MVFNFSLVIVSSFTVPTPHSSGQAHPRPAFCSFIPEYDKHLPESHHRSALFPPSSLESDSPDASPAVNRSPVSQNLSDKVEPPPSFHTSICGTPGIPALYPGRADKDTLPAFPFSAHNHPAG